MSMKIWTCSGLRLHGNSATKLSALATRWAALHSKVLAASGAISTVLSKMMGVGDYDLYQHDPGNVYTDEAYFIESNLGSLHIVRDERAYRSIFSDI